MSRHHPTGPRFVLALNRLEDRDVPSAPTSDFVLARAAFVAAGDVDGDRAPDLVAVTPAPGAGGFVVDVLHNDPEEGFVWTGEVRAPRDMASGQAAGLALGDVDSDGDLDIVVAASATTGDLVGILNNDGSGGFDPGRSFVLPHVLEKSGRIKFDLGGPRKVDPFLAVADVNADRLPDIVVAAATKSGDAQVDLLLGDGAGGFAGRTFLAPHVFETKNARFVAAGDVNGDGAAELVAVDGSSIIVMPVTPDAAKGAIKIVTPQRDVAFGPNDRVILADVNRDARPDLVVVVGGAVYTGVNTADAKTGATSFTWSGDSTPIVKGSTRYLFVGDVDRDGDLDLFSVAQGPGHSISKSIIANIKA